MSLTLFLRVLVARWPWVAVLTLLGAGGAAALVEATPRQYTAEANLMVNFGGGGTAIDDAYPASLFSDYVATQMNLIDSRAVGVKAVEDLGLQGRAGLMRRFEHALDGPLARLRGLTERIAAYWSGPPDAPPSPAQRARDLADALRHHLAVGNTDGSGMLNLSFSSSDPWVSAQVVNAFARAYLGTNVDLNAEPAREDAKWFNGQIQGLSDNLERAQAALSRFQQRNSIVATDERVDTETARLQDLSSQLTVAQTKSYALQADQQQVHEYLAGGSGTGLIPDVLNDPVVQQLKESIADQRRKLSEVASRVGHNHPEYIGAEAQLKALQERLVNEIGGISRGIDASVAAAATRRQSLVDAVAAQKGKVLSLRHDRDRLDLLKTKVDNAQRVYDAALRRMSQARIQSHSTRSSVSLVNKAVAPTRPSGPHAVRYLAGGVVAGLVIGIGLALWREVRDRRVRSRDDVQELLGLPVFATVTPRPARRPSRRPEPPPRLLPRLGPDV